MYRQPSGPVFCDDRHEPGVVGREEVRPRLAEVGRAVARQHVAVDAVAVDVAHVELVAVLRRIGVAVEVVEAAVGRLLMLVLDDRVDLPGERRIRAALAMVIAGLGQVPEMVDDAGADEGAALGVPGDAPGVARPLAEQLKSRVCG